MPDFAVAAADPLAVHGCLHAAVIVYRDQKVWYPCRSHDGGLHRFAATRPACPAPWCRLPPGHHPETLHDIPPGTVELHHPLGAVASCG